MILRCIFVIESIPRWLLRVSELLFPAGEKGDNVPVLPAAPRAAAAEQEESIGFHSSTNLLQHDVVVVESITATQW